MCWRLPWKFSKYRIWRALALVNAEVLGEDVPGKGVGSLCPPACLALASTSGCSSVCVPLPCALPWYLHPAVHLCVCPFPCALPWCLHPAVHLCVCLVAQSCLTLCNPMACSLPDSSVHGDSPGKNTGVGCHALLQGRRDPPRDQTLFSHVAGRFFSILATMEALFICILYNKSVSESVTLNSVSYSSKSSNLGRG